MMIHHPHALLRYSVAILITGWVAQFWILTPAQFSKVPKIQGCAHLTVANRWDEKAGLRRDALSSQVIDALEAHETPKVSRSQQIRVTLMDRNPASQFGHVVHTVYLRAD
jgi:hypothetical protein